MLSYYHTEYSNYNVKIYIDGKLKYDDSMQLVYTFGHEYLNVVEFFRNTNTKTIIIYTNEY